MIGILICRQICGDIRGKHSSLEGYKAHFKKIIFSKSAARSSFYDVTIALNARARARCMCRVGDPVLSLLLAG